MSDPTDDKVNDRSGWVVFGFVVTAAYVAFIAWLLLLSDWVTRTAPPMANEWGDLLAGAFAPLAFLWLLIAVMVQAQELKLQRRELTLTRQGFEESRVLARAQGNEAKKQAEFIGRQTEIMVGTEEDRIRERRSAQVRAIARSIIEQISRSVDDASWKIVSSGTSELAQLQAYHKWLIDNAERTDSYFTSDAHGALLHYVAVCAEQLRNMLPSVSGDVYIELSLVNPAELADLAYLIRNRIELLNSRSTAAI
nr:hypothetical protein [Mesorhizobium sp.]